MRESISRRQFFSAGRSAALLAGGGVIGGPRLPVHREQPQPAGGGVDYYRKLGVVPFINAAGTYTILSASTMPDEVQAAISLAAQKPVHLLELQAAAGKYLAEKLH